MSVTFKVKNELGETLPNSFIRVGLLSLPAPDGTLALDIAPGKYEVSALCLGYNQQSIGVIIEEGTEEVEIVLNTWRRQI